MAPVLGEAWRWEGLHSRKYNIDFIVKRSLVPRPRPTWPGNEATQSEVALVQGHLQGKSVSQHGAAVAAWHS